MKILRFRLRPKFEQVLDLTESGIQGKISSHFQEELRSFEVKRFPGFICIRIPEEDRHFWSPRLNLHITQPEGQKGSLIEGIYGPNANVWALLLFCYLILIFFALIGGILGLVQQSIGDDPWGFWVCGISSAAVVILYLIARVGRMIGERQVLRLHRAYERALGETVAIR